MTLYKAEVNVTDTATATSTTFIWTVASVSAVGYAGTNGTNGTSVTGPQGASARYAYARIANGSVPVSGTYTVGGDNLPSFTNTWGSPFNTSWSSIDPNPSSTNTLYQTDGLYNPDTNQTTWTTPYVSSLKVGSLQAVTTNTGDLTVTGDFKAGTAQVSGTTMTGAGGILKNGGNFAFGNATTNIAFNGSQLTLNGNVVNTANVVTNAVNDVYITTSETASSLSLSVPIPANCSGAVILVGLGSYISGDGKTIFEGPASGTLKSGSTTLASGSGAVIYAIREPAAGTYNLSATRYGYNFPYQYTAPFTLTVQVIKR
jgi:hypothetical protein